MKDTRRQRPLASVARVSLLALVVASVALAGAARPRQASALALRPGQADFNGDGFADLPIEVHGEAVGAADGAGAVNVIYGSAAGLTSTGNQIWTQNDVGTAEALDDFGWELAHADFNRDGYTDLVIGAPGEAIGDMRAAGAVHVLYGGSGGLSSAGSQFWHQNSANIPDSAEEVDRFGRYLTAGDFNADGRADLAIGVAGEDLGALMGAGAVNVLYGSATGLSSTGNQVWHQDQPGVAGAAETGDGFGQSLSAGDFNGDGFADLAAGAPGEAVGNIVEAGAVNVLYGGPGGLTGTGSQIWHRNQADVDGTAAAEDAFGIVLSAGDFDGDGRSDLAVGTPGETGGTAHSTGTVRALYGAPGGLGTAGMQLWHQDSPGIQGSAEPGDGFGGFDF